MEQNKVRAACRRTEYLPLRRCRLRPLQRSQPVCHRLPENQPFYSAAASAGKMR
ncbi:hypothetical protein HMPREF9371_1905 [Neisseria shayeganii 871]|uniref:Uncharacterized protein n=1 Tax=Neisseria shayeganii 871 TaxID=1032488 RepID=G4CJW5_9NEIS|nr:hypothetical protein HMPREF9371_1905 [Neisseria shayeganii 871]